MRAVPAGKLTEMVGAWVQEKVGGITFAPGMYQAMMVVNDSGDLVAAVVVSNYQGHDCQISCASETGAAWRPHVCRAVFTYIFETLGCVRCTSITTKRNTASRGFLEHLGFTLEGKLRRGYDGKHDALIFGLLAEECRFLAEQDSEAIDLNGQEFTPSPGSTGPRSDGERAGADEPRDGDYSGEPEPDQSSDAAGEFDVLV